MKLHIASAMALAALAVGSGAAWADDALDTLQGMHMTAPIDWPTVPQTGPKADAVKQILTRSNFRQGFISTFTLWCLTPGTWPSAHKAW
jgi:hypothetical protein